MIKKIIAISMALIVVFAGILILDGVFAKDEKLNLKLTTTIVNVDTGETMESTVDLGNVNTLEMLSSLTGAIRSSDFKPLDTVAKDETQNTRTLSKNAKYKVMMALDVKITAPTNKFSGVESSYCYFEAAPAGGNFGQIKTGDKLAEVKKVERRDWIKDLNTPVTVEQYLPDLRLGDTNGDWVKYYDGKNWKDITGTQINGMKFRVGLSITLKTVTGEKVVFDGVTALLTLKVPDWYEDYAKIEVTKITHGVANA